MTPTDELKKAAEAYAKSVGDDCLNQRTSPGTPVGECTYIFCGCHVNDAFLAGARYQDPISREAGRAEVLELLRSHAASEFSHKSWQIPLDPRTLANWIESKLKGAR